MNVMFNAMWLTCCGGDLLISHDNGLGIGDGYSY